MHAGMTFNDNTTWYGTTYDVIGYNDNAESDEMTYVVVASFASYDDARAFTERRDTERVYVGIRPPNAEYVRVVRWLAANL